ncbi:transposase [Microbacterium sp. RU33B]|uniref:transposase n=1 Tax=Microbacterium sp. RU33B TaxID=1907390 RepID=UPI00095AAFF0|nr:transposase [Microbacterium sp. RU33B]SIT82684.1 hypothetical protein SAMN05880545_1945 [Microbacterium sp. RU33B]
MPARDDAIDAVAADLAALPPAEFTAARNARASAEGDRGLAAQIKTLPKPQVSAWAVTLLAREGGLGEALELSAALREAQDGLDAPELAVLGRQRRALVSALARQAADLARARGVAVSTAASGEIERTIDAAIRDPAAAAAVRSGRLVRPLVADGIDPVDLDGAVSGSLPDGTPPPPRSRDDLAERRARKEAERAVREAEREAATATRELTRIDEKLGQARERADLVAERLAGLRADLARLEAEEAERREGIAALEDERRAAASVARDAEKKAERARRMRGSET